jgi:hypothetical protein
MRAPILLLAALAACGSSAAPSTTTPKAAPAPRERVAVPPSIAAGVFWIPYESCPTCDEPKALAAYVAADVATARSIASRLDGALDLGLPFVAHAQEIGLAREAIVVAIGAYATRAEAEAAVRVAPPIAGRTAEVIDVPSYEAMVGGEVKHHVVRIDRGGPVKAWSAADVQEIEDAANESSDPATHATEASRRRWIAERLSARKPACTVEPGEFFVADRDQVRWYEYAPVRCGDAPAYVPWKASLLGHATVVREGTGYRLYQVVGAQCDSPIVESWKYDENGRRVEPAPDESKPTRIARC